MENNHIFTPKIAIRFLSFLVDAFLFFIFAFVLTFFVFNNVFSPVEDNKFLQETLVYSNLYVANENNIYGQLNNGTSQDYKDIVESYYLTVDDRSNKENDKVNYFESDFYKEHGGIRKPLTIEEYNNRILYAGEEDSYFEFRVIDGTIDKTEIAVIKPKYLKENYESQNLEYVLDEYKGDFLSFYTSAYKNCFTDLYNDDFYVSARDNINKLSQYNLGLSCLIPAAIIYGLIPLLNYEHKTVGRAIFKLGLCNLDGYRVKTFQVALRIIPSIILSILPFFIGDLLILLSITFGYILISACSTIIVSDNVSIVDFISMSRVVDLKSSKIFKNYDDLKEKEDLLYGD